MNFSKFKYSFERDGILGLLNTLLGKLGFRFRLKTLIHKRILYLQKELKLLSNDQVFYGLYKGMKISDIFWSQYDYCPKILGLYESEIQSEIKISKKKYFINIGSAEGYHAIGQLLQDKEIKCICFEAEKESRKLLKIKAEINNVADRLLIFEKADENFLKLIKLNLPLINYMECCFLFDIEGGEFEILDENNLKILSKSKLIIEFHEKNIDKNFENLNFIKLLERFYSISFLTTSVRDLSVIKELRQFSDIDRWIMASENRPNLMKWIVCNPKN